MNIFEYDEEKHIKSERKEWREIGNREGRALLSQILKSLIDAGKNDELQRALSDSDYQEQLVQEYLLRNK